MATVNVITMPETYYGPTDYSPVEDVRWRNQPQTVAMTAGVMLFIAGGMDLAFGLGWNLSTNVTTTEQLLFSWFVGFIGGTVLAAPLIPYLHKRLYLLISALMVLASGIIYVSVPHDYSAILAARYVNGIGIGFSIVAFIVQGGEIAAPSYRGAVLSLEQYAFTFGMAIQVIYASQWTSTDFAANILHGILVIVFAVAALGSIYLVVESPVFYLRKSNEEAALDCLRLLQRPQIVTNDTKAMLESLRVYVIQEENQSIGENFRKAMYPFIKVLLYRCMVTFSFSIVSSYSIIAVSYYNLGYGDSWPPIVFAVLRVFGAFLALWLVDSLGRKAVSLLSLLCLGGLTIAVGALFSDNDIFEDSHQTSVVCCLLLISQFFAGLFVPSTSVYLGEAFPLVLKPYLITICVSMEQVIQIIGILAFCPKVYFAYEYCIVVGIIMCGFSIFFYLTIPETRNTTLSEAQKRFRNLLYLKVY